MSLLDTQGREHQYLLISITEACNLRCIYCRPEDDAQNPVVSGAIPSAVPCEAFRSKFAWRIQTMPYEQFVQIIRLASRFGFRKVRITGGEPLLHPDISRIVKQTITTQGIEDVSLTTNGTLLPDFIHELKQAGLRRINISLDSLNPQIYARITRRDTLNRVLEGIEASLQAGLNPVKLNVVLLKGINEGEIPQFLALARDYPVHVRFIECMPFLPAAADLFISTDLVKQRAKEAGLSLIPIQEKGRLEGPAELYRIPGAKGLLGLIHPMSRHFCGQCNRLRVTAEGSLRPCLLRDHEVPPGRVLSDPTKAFQVFREALSMKGTAHALHINHLLHPTGDKKAKVEPSTGRFPDRRMYAIGG